MKTEEQKAVEDRLRKAQDVRGRIESWKKWAEEVSRVTCIQLTYTRVGDAARVEGVGLSPWGQKAEVPVIAFIVESVVKYAEAKIASLELEYEAL